MWKVQKEVRPKHNDNGSCLARKVTNAEFYDCNKNLSSIPLFYSQIIFPSQKSLLSQLKLFIWLGRARNYRKAHNIPSVCIRLRRLQQAHIYIMGIKFSVKTFLSVG